MPRESSTDQKTDPNSRRTTRRRPPLTAFDRVLMLLAKRDHSRKEIREKLARAEHSSEEIEDAIADAEARNWLPSEEDLAAREAARLSRAGRSGRQIAVWLKKKGLPFVRPQGVDGDDPQELERRAAYKTAEKSWNRLVRSAEKDAAKAPPRGPRRTLDGCLKMRVTRLLTGKGFSLQTAQAVYARLLEENPLK